MGLRLLSTFILILLMLVVGTSFEATAQVPVYPCSTSKDVYSSQCPDEGKAYAAAWAVARAVAQSSNASSPGVWCPGVKRAGGATAYTAYVTPCANQGPQWETRTRTWPQGQECSSQTGGVTPFFPPSGSTRCREGCEFQYRDNGDDTTTYSATGKVCDGKPECTAGGRNMGWNAMLGVCQPGEPECPEGKVKVGNACADEKPCPDGMALVAGSCKKKDEECPSGMVRSPLGSCIPGDGQCAKGEVRGPDGTCKRDSDNDGDPAPTGPDDPETFSGGDACNAPPSCSGSPIMCGQARIQWRIECNTRRNNNISGGHCSQSGMPTCTGEKCNAMEYAGLLMQWRSACALEKMAGEKAESPGTSKTDANGNGVPDALEGRGEVTGIGDNAADIASAKKWGIGLSTDSLDTSNMFGGAGTCPEPPAITIMGKTVSSAEFPYFCRIAAILRALILIFGAYSAIRILMGGLF